MYLECLLLPAILIGMLDLCFAMYRRVKAKLHALRGCIDDLMDDVDSETNPLHGVAVKCSRNYNDWNLGYRILLCTLLEVY